MSPWKPARLRCGMGRVRKRTRGAGSQERKEQKQRRADASPSVQEERVLAWKAVNKLLDRKEERR